MFLQLNHQKLDIYQVSKAFVKECYFITKGFPTEERFFKHSKSEEQPYLFI